MKRLLILLLPLFSSCKFVPYTGNDIYDVKADITKDEAVHFKNSLEWWYFTGHLQDSAGAEYGIEYVFFHFNPRNKADYLLTNFAITDPEGKRFIYDYKFEKQDSLLSPQLPLHLRVEDKNRRHILKGMAGTYEIEANMNGSDVAVSLKTSPDKPLLLHNGTGYEQYGDYAQAGYYSYPRLKTTGTITIAGKNIPVDGQLWYDRQWNCVGVWQKEIAWDWVSIQLDSPRSEIMLYRLYHFGDETLIYGGSYFDENGELLTLKKDDITFEEQDYWVSMRSKAKYPIKWKIKVKPLDAEFTVEARIPDQELGLSFTPLHKLYYWEGMCSVKGSMAGKPVAGKSYIELTNRDRFNKSDQ